MSIVRLALDRSVRSYDSDRRLRVATAVLTRACVSPYLGGEVPDYRSLGLTASRVYQLLRPERELRAALDGFKWAADHPDPARPGQCGRLSGRSGGREHRQQRDAGQWRGVEFTDDLGIAWDRPDRERGGAVTELWLLLYARSAVGIVSMGVSRQVRACARVMLHKPHPRPRPQRWCRGRHSDETSGYLARQADALYRQGDELGDNTAGR
jgi:hypothetical protein